MANRLSRERSPYLLQHAGNPVDWYPWGDEAFAKARGEMKPILLSIGYSTCHWCHVMEHDAFSVPEIAEVLNRHFVAIKVDREERPDVDDIYMSAIMEMTGQGGWPLNVFLTPELKPFYGGTYFPPEPMYGRPSFRQVLEGLAQAWRDDREKIETLGSRNVETLTSMKDLDAEPKPLEKAWLDQAFLSLQFNFDQGPGGFGGAPKFPMPVYMNFLLRHHARTKDADVLRMVTHSLRQMAMGGIHDQLGGGFHRYSTDSRWFLPHFEKMLYDNAQLTVNYLETFAVTQDPFFLSVAEKMIRYVLRDMRHKNGGFYSAEDADSLAESGHKHKVEGAFYVWTKKEIAETLGEKAAEPFCSAHGVQDEGNVANDPQGEFHKKNVLFVPPGLEAEAELLEESREKLLARRSQRPRPHLDDKVLTSWNGLMISALAKAYQATHKREYLEAAAQAAAFLHAELFKDNHLYHMWRDGLSPVPGLLEDHAFLIQGLLDLYESGFEEKWLFWAMDLTETMIQKFHDPQNGGFFTTAATHDPNLLVRSKETRDGVEPAGASVACLVLFRFAQITGRADWRACAEKVLNHASPILQTAPTALSQMLVSLDYFFSSPQEIVIAGSNPEPLVRTVHSRFLPHKVLLLATPALAERFPHIQALPLKKSQSVVYVCQNFACQSPITDPKKLEALLG